MGDFRSPLIFAEELGFVFEHFSKGIAGLVFRDQLKLHEKNG